MAIEYTADAVENMPLSRRFFHASTITDLFWVRYRYVDVNQDAQWDHCFLSPSDLRSGHSSLTRTGALGDLNRASVDDLPLPPPPPDIDPQDPAAETPHPTSVPGQQSGSNRDVKKDQEKTDRRQQQNSASPSKSVTVPPGNTPAPSSTPSAGPPYQKQPRPRGDDDEDEDEEGHHQAAQEVALEHSEDTSDDNQDRVSSNWILCRPEGDTAEGDSTMVYRYKIRDDNTVEGSYIDGDGVEISIIETQRDGASEGHVNPVYQSESNIAEPAAAAPAAELADRKEIQPTKTTRFQDQKESVKTPTTDNTTKHDGETTRASNNSMRGSKANGKCSREATKPKKSLEDSER